MKIQIEFETGEMTPEEIFLIAATLQESSVRHRKSVLLERFFGVFSRTMLAQGTKLLAEKMDMEKKLRADPSAGPSGGTAPTRDTLGSGEQR